MAAKDKKSAPTPTPESATGREKSVIDDRAVSEAVTVKDGPKSVLPGPPIPPETQAALRQAQDLPDRKQKGQKGEKAMIDTNDIREHMEVVGSDGEHVGTVDHCEGPDIIKLTKNDPAAGGEHHYIPLAWVERIDQRVHLAHPGNEARAHWS